LPLSARSILFPYTTLFRSSPAFKPMNKDIQDKTTIGPIKATFLLNRKGAKRSISSVNRLGESFQNTSDHIFAITYKVTKLAKIIAPNNAYCSAFNDSPNN